MSRPKSRMSSSVPHRRSRSRSRPSRPNSIDLDRVHSSQFPDDHAIYHNHEELKPEHFRRGGQDERTQNVSEPYVERSSGADVSREEVEEKVDDSEKETSDDESNAPGTQDQTYGRAGPTSAHHDIENTPKLSKEKTKDPNLVTWNGDDDPENPKNWTFKTKWAATFVVSSFTFISPVSSSMVAPAISAISRDLGITQTVESQLTISIFVAAYAVGPLFLGPLSEIYGRVPVLQLANAFYFAWNLGCGFAQNKAQLITFRFLAGLGGSAPLAIGGGVLADCWKAEERGKAISVYSLAPLLGPAVGPIAGGFIAENTTWRWCFWSTSAACILIQFSGLFFLRETYAPKILGRKKQRLIKETGNNKLHTEFDHPDMKLLALLRVSFVRPFRLLFTQPIIIMLALFMAYLYGLMYLMLSTFPTLWEKRYGMRVDIGGLNYIALGVGFFIGVQAVAPLNDAIYRRLEAKNHNVGLPEFRVPLMVPGALLVPIGLFWYGWSAQAKAFWLVPDIGAAIVTAGIIIEYQCIQSYLVDAYTRYAASAYAATTVLRSLAGFGFPLFGPAMYDSLDYGWGNSVLGFVAIAIGFPAPFVLWFYGAKLRATSKFAAG